MADFPFPPAGAAPRTVVVRERVGLGLLASLLCIPLGALVSVIIWKLGFVSGISSFVVAFSAAFLYLRAAGSAPRAGLVPLIVVIVVGVAVSFLAVVASDLWTLYGDDDLGRGGQSRVSFVSSNLFDGDVLSAYKRDLIYFVIFGALGIFSSIRRLVAGR